MEIYRSDWLFTSTFAIVVLMTSMTTAITGQHAENGPVIKTDTRNPMNEKKEILLQKGQNFTITCIGDRPLNIQQQIAREEPVGKFSMNLEEYHPKSNELHRYGRHLNLYNVDHYAAGYYACFDDTVDSEKLLLDIKEEPIDSEHATFIYIYVNDDDPEPGLFAPMSQFAIKLNSSHVILPCRPSMPGVNVTITLDDEESKNDYEKYTYDPKIGFTVDVDDYPGHVLLSTCTASRSNIENTKLFLVEKPRPQDACSGITIVRNSKYFMKGDTFTLNCSVPFKFKNEAVNLVWSGPWNTEEVSTDNNANRSIGFNQPLYHAITITKASRQNEGNYTCTCQGIGIKHSKSETKKYLENATMELTTTQGTFLEHAKELNLLELKVRVTAYPKPFYTFFWNNKLLNVDTANVKTNCRSSGAVKYRLVESKLTNDVTLKICNFTVFDAGNYTVVANNTHIVKNITFDVRKKASPMVELWPAGDVTYQELNQRRSLRCDIISYPLPKVEWFYHTDDGDVRNLKGTEIATSVYKYVSSITISPSESGNLTCKATQDANTSIATKRVLVYEIAHGFGIVNNKTWYPEGHSVSLKCLASIYEFYNVSWRGPSGDELSDNVIYDDNSKLSHSALLVISQITLSDDGTYTCVGYRINGSQETKSITISVEAVRAPIIREPQRDRELDVEKNLHVNFSCIADAVPSPKITWYKDNVLLTNNTDEVKIFYYLNHTLANSTIVIDKMQIENEGKYTCTATSANLSSSKHIDLKVQQQFPNKSAVIGGVVSVMLLLITLVIYLMWKVRKEKQFRKELAAAGLLYFKEGVTKSLNPDLAIDEQAELLPYDERFEFPVEKLTLGKQLGAGAFGVVYKAEARGIINAEETTPVAVKMVKKAADNMYIKALASELKIMVHLGKHVNIVNLLGACTKKVGKRELIVIVEYCKFGNIHNYMQKHREVFIDQLTDSKEKNLGKVNRGFSCSSGSSGLNSDYFGAHSQVTGHTMLNTANTNRSERKAKQNKQEKLDKVSETGYVMAEPEWRSNYESDYSFDGRSPRPLCSRDLLAWAFQIARGMEYLSSRKILHGDLAARNVLLAEDNVIKICDFGLAKSIYKNDEYQKKENSPLPVKWLAIECMVDRIFSTQSDVWAFGIVLWELFSLARTPYPNIPPQHLIEWLSSGHRLEKPPYADDRLYDLMKRCWEQKPTARPSFSQLQELLGSFLEDNVRNHYVDLNSAFVDMNVKIQREDYLAMVSAPDYNNLVTPSPHNYVNDVRSFFPPSPTQVPLDEEGYLQMTPHPSIFSPRNQSGTRFDFDTKKINPRVAETKGGSELTPMLTLNNLPARSGSDSDHEGHSPYLKMCPRISEESDEVFKLKENNEKNIQNSAVSNPTYISLDLDIDKKPQDINSYINIPNGLVK